MSYNIYPALVYGDNVDHADNWEDESTLNIANGNMYKLVETLGIKDLEHLPTTIRVITLRRALKASKHTIYHERLGKICARAEILKVPHIAFV